MPICALCDRDVDETTEHHLIPKTRHKNKKNKKLFTREEVKERKISVCRPCHDNIHALFSEKVLAREYNTLEKLENHPSIIKFTNWIKNKPIDTNIPNRRNKGRR